MNCAPRLLACQMLLLACSGSATTPSQPSQSRAEVLSPRSQPAYEYHASGRIAAIGDVHGDLSVARKVLRLAGAIDEADHWQGGSLVVVQTGDTIDRGDDDRAVLDLIERLRGEAKRAGGAFIAMSGNHEVMNVSGDFRYVSEVSASAFEQGRAQAFAPGGAYARVLASWPVITKVERTVFVHGGVLSQHVKYGVDRLNEETAAWMRGERGIPEVMAREDAPVWTRLYSADEGASTQEICAELQRVLTALDADRMVVGHTPQLHGISAACDGKVWRIDTGMSHFYGGPLQWLALEGGKVEPRVEAR